MIGASGNIEFRLPPRGLVPLLACAVACACGDAAETTSIDVVVTEAEPGLPMRPDRVTLVVTYQDTEGVHEVLRRETTASVEGPLEPWSTRVRPIAPGHAGQVVYRFEVVASREGRAYVTKEQRLVFLPDTRIVLPIRLEAACVERTCEPEQTCGDGLCGTSHVSACTLVRDGRPAFCGQEQESVVALGAGFNHACAGRSDGSVWCWGMNSAGQLGDLRLDHTPCASAGDYDCAAPVRAREADGAVAVAPGFLHTCALFPEASVRCWGDGTYGALGAGVVAGDACDADRRIDACRPSAGDVGLVDVVAIDSGFGHVCALDRSGSVSCWGQDERGQLGEGAGSPDRCGGGTVQEIPCSRLPVRVDGLEGVSAISAGRTHTCALRGGEVLCWGDDSEAQLGDGDVPHGPCDGDTGTVCVERPVVVPGIDDVVAIATGDFHTCALRADATVWCWGSDGAGQLGTGQGGLSHVPARVPDLLDVAQIDAGRHATYARMIDGTVRAWGADTNGALGNDVPLLGSPAPVAVNGLVGVTEIAAGEYFACARTGADDVRCWGINGGRQLGDGTTEDRSTPVPIAW